MSNSTNRQASINSRRIDLEREIAIRVPRFDSFVTEYSANISTTGMFIVSKSPQAPGTTFPFEFSVADDWKLIRGTAHVVWTRYRDEGPERPSGMGVKFLELDAQSRRLIRWIVEKHIREGGKPFELDDLRTAVDEALEQALDTGDALAGDSLEASASAAPTPKRSTVSVRSAATYTARRQSEERRLLPLILTAGAILVAVALLFWLTELIPDKPRDRTAQRSAEAPVDAETGRTLDLVPEQATDAGAAAARNSPPPPIGSAYSSAVEAVTQWADAWSRRDVDAYLSAYSRAFTPDGNLRRDQWAAQRRERVLAPDYIKVSISGLDFERLGDDRAEVSFVQNYRSDRYDDMVRKTIELAWEDGTWKIIRERAD